MKPSTLFILVPLEPAVVVVSGRLRYALTANGLEMHHG
jgi:hypothetical protein